MTIRSLLLLSLFLLSGCGAREILQGFGSQDDDTELLPTPLTKFTSHADITKVWSVDTGVGFGEQYLRLSPAVYGERLFVVDSDGVIKAFSIENGKLLWKKKTDLLVTGGIDANESTLLLGTSEAEAIAFSAEAGEQIWNSRVSSEVLALPRQAEDIVIIRTIDGKIFALSQEDGRRLWIYDRTVPSLTLRGTSSPVLTGELVIVGFDGGRLSALELFSGKLIWETRIAVASGRSDLDRMVDIDGDPVVFEGMVYVASFQNQISAIKLDSGLHSWSRDISSYAGLDVDEQRVYVTDEGSNIFSLDRFSGETIWKQEKLQKRASTGPRVVGDLVVVGDFEGYLHWIDKHTGEFIARNRVSNARLIAAPILSDGVIYAYSSDGTIGAYAYSNFRK